MSLAESFDAPIVETIGGKAYTFPILTIDDLTAIGREVFHDKMAREIAAASLTDAGARNEIAAYYGGLEHDIDGYCTLAATPSSAIKFLALSARKAGSPHEVIDQLKAERGLRGVVSLALEVSGLYPPNPRRKVIPPNAEAADADRAAASQPESAPTTSSPGSPSGELTATPAA